MISASRPWTPDSNAASSPACWMCASSSGLRLVVRLLDARRMDAPVGQQLLERHAGDLAAHAVERRQHDRAGRVIDDEVDAGEVLERADVAPLATDDAALHVVGWQLHDADRRLGGVARGEALHRDGQDRAHAPLGVALGLLLDLADLEGALVADLVGDLSHQPLLGLPGAEAGDLLERRLVLAPAALELLALGLERARLVVELADAAVEVLRARVEALLETHELLAVDGSGRRGRRTAPARDEHERDHGNHHGHRHDRCRHDQLHLPFLLPRSRTRSGWCGPASTCQGVRTGTAGAVGRRRSAPCFRDGSSEGRSARRSGFVERDRGPSSEAVRCLKNVFGCWVGRPHGLDLTEA